jgi:hypothetical protein
MPVVNDKIQIGNISKRKNVVLILFVSLLINARFVLNLRPLTFITHLFKIWKKHKATLSTSFKEIRSEKISMNKIWLEENLMRTLTW